MIKIKFQRQISLFLLGLTKMLVALGQTSRGDTDSVELIDLESAAGNDICEKFPDFPVVTKSPGIELDFQSNPIVCGGGTPSRCQSFKIKYF